MGQCPQMALARVARPFSLSVSLSLSLSSSARRCVCLIPARMPGRDQLRSGPFAPVLHPCVCCARAVRVVTSVAMAPLATAMQRPCKYPSRARDVVYG